MKNFKVYKHTNSADEDIGFRISNMEDIYEERGGKADDPHRHNYFTVLIIRQAYGVHKIDFNEYALGAYQLFFVAPGQVHQIIEKDKSKGYVLTFSSEFLIQNSIPLAFMDTLSLFQNFGHNPPLLLTSQEFAIVEEFAKKICLIFQSEANMKEQSIGAYLKLLLIACNNICSMDPISSNMSSSDNMIRAFKQLVNQHYKKAHATSFYANKLNITSDHLNRVVKRKSGKTAKAFIQARIILEAKRLMYFSGLSNKEIAYELGFNEPSNFSNFFKKHTNLSPSSFRKQEIKT